ncbi:ABC transporter ATP-binding protein [Labedaea rhizosphaerae]|uniref:ATP-binding cassette subfamily B protein n=1 Tax=Labedaea rhizosphaerae TaxID=598644 RepID=A0A4R6SNS0_LABRH|nr:ABC transporter ATP-binding protein [Labedaea rhizosphaerae]TDQ05677.1 ATP-binding cassette subfamily B protein [Labedaea rhizosphaerae]
MDRVRLLPVDRLAVPEWAKASAEVASAGLLRSMRAVPSVVATIGALAWRASRVLTATAVVLQVVSGAVTAFGLLATTQVFTALLQDSPTPQRLSASLPVLAVVVAAVAARAFLDSAVSAVEASLRPAVARSAEDAVTAAAARVSLISFEDAEFQELVRRASSDGLEAIASSVRSATQLISAVVSMTAAVVAAAVIDPRLAVVLALAAAADGWASVRASRLGRWHFLDTVTRRMTKSVVAEAATARRFAVERHALVLRERLLREHRALTADLAREETRLARRTALVRLAGRAVSGVGTAAAYGVLVLLLWTGSLPLGVAGTAVLAVRAASAALTACLRTVDLIHESAPEVELHARLLTEAARRAERRTGSTAPADPAVIRLTAVSFAYPGQHRPAVRDVDLTIRRGQVIALVGENGSGKTTLAKLITGLYPAGGGTVHWDDVDVAAADPDTVHERVAVIAQAPAEWPMTAEHAIRIGRHDKRVPDAHWHHALTASGADEVLAALPDGPDTVLSRRFHNGQDLSGGQWQRIAIARGIYRAAPILVADEPTAALDAKAEARVFAALRAAGTNRTTILVTHRLANVRTADWIVVMDRGRIVEQGTHDHLHAAEGHYHDLYETQARAYR